MKNVHSENDHERIERVTDTVKSALKQELIKNNTKQGQGNQCRSPLFAFDKFSCVKNKSGHVDIAVLVTYQFS